MSNERKRRCAECGAPAKTRARFCTQWGGDRLIWMPIQRALEEEPSVACHRCGQRIEAAFVWHSRQGGKPFCKPCKHREETEAC